MRSVEELERAMLEGARRGLAPSASDRMRVQTLLLGNEAWFQPAPVQRSSIRSFVRSWRGGAALGFALGAVIGFGASQGLGLLSPRAIPVEPPPAAVAAGPARVTAPVVAPAPLAQERAAPGPESVSAAADRSGGALADEAPEKAVAVSRRDAASRSGPRATALEEERSTLAQELALLQRARRALNRQEARLALGIVQSLDERFPDGVLMEERAATRILSLCQLERADEARVQGQQFLAAHPRSVYAERVRNSCAGKQ